ncbi:H-2 class II histocompatibility antigen, E-S beta chain-like isoform X2 [Rhineura floridana]|uniref:H-2 class II histocompatibility antigen, E-S beta chain-like isoform X2 n=1 Tax=Rhineura floridana TaxID=261503 RepID=UPI002AC88B57|nr:H-2 class II histocompatibility antigen, E-S beta chain-like isoform X2 [Rhineura floridana]
MRWPTWRSSAGTTTGSTRPSPTPAADAHLHVMSGFESDEQAESNAVRSLDKEATLLAGSPKAEWSKLRHQTKMHPPRVQPKVVITPTEYDSVSHNALLICTVAAFYPAKIEIKWFRNGEEETGVWTTDVTRNGDWTFQIEVMLETQPKRGDVYACQVEHASFAGPVTVQWEAQSDSAKSKMWTGIVGLVLGLVFVAPGLFLCVRNKKGLAVPQSPGLMR